MADNAGEDTNKKTEEQPPVEDNKAVEENTEETTTTTEEEKPASDDKPADSEDKPKENGDAEDKPAENGDTPTENKTEEGSSKSKDKGKKEEKEFKMTGRVMIVTGASGGLGFAVANYLCEGGNDVILACRNEDKANRAIERIKQKNPNALATFLQLDLADLESVRKFVDDFHALEKPLHVLINNAGVALNPKDTKRQYTKENFELTIGTNHFGPFLLTNLLLDDLKKSSEGEDGDARIINVSSSVHDPESMKRRNKQMRDLQPLDIDNILLFNEGTYNGLQAYKNSKAANIMFTYELARKLEGTNVKVNAVCPGFVPSTELMRNSSGMQKFFYRYIVHGVLRMTKMTKTIPQASQAVISLATDDKFKDVTGKYIKEGAEAQSSEETRDEDKQKKLFEASAGYVRMDGYEVIEVPEPPKEEEKKEKEKKKEEKKEEGDAKAEDGETKEEEKEKKDDEKKEEAEDEKKDEDAKKDDADEKKEEVEEEKKEEKEESEKKEENTTEEKKE